MGLFIDGNIGYRGHELKPEGGALERLRHERYREQKSNSMPTIRRWIRDIHMERVDDNTAIERATVARTGPSCRLSSDKT